jgi:hypothetical protein
MNALGSMRQGRGNITRTSGGSLDSILGVLKELSQTFNAIGNAILKYVSITLEYCMLDLAFTEYESTIFTRKINSPSLRHPSEYHPFPLGPVPEADIPEHHPRCFLVQQASCCESPQPQPSDRPHPQSYSCSRTAPTPARCHSTESSR